MKQDSGEVLPKSPDRAAYESAYRKLQAEGQHFDAFNGLIASVPDERRDALTEVYRSLHDNSLRNLLDEEKMEELKRKNEPLFQEVQTYYSKYLKKLAGIE